MVIASNLPGETKLQEPLLYPEYGAPGTPQGIATPNSAKAGAALCKKNAVPPEC